MSKVAPRKVVLPFGYVALSPDRGFPVLDPARLETTNAWAFVGIMKFGAFRAMLRTGSVLDLDAAGAARFSVSSATAAVMTHGLRYALDAGNALIARALVNLGARLENTRLFRVLLYAAGDCDDVSKYPVTARAGIDANAAREHRLSALGGAPDMSRAAGLRAAAADNDADRAAAATTESAKTKTVSHAPPEPTCVYKPAPAPDSAIYLGPPYTSMFIARMPPAMLGGAPYTITAVTRALVNRVRAYGLGAPRGNSCPATSAAVAGLLETDDALSFTWVVASIPRGISPSWMPSIDGDAARLCNIRMFEFVRGFVGMRDTARVDEHRTSPRAAAVVRATARWFDVESRYNMCSVDARLVYALLDDLMAHVASGIKAHADVDAAAERSVRVSSAESTLRLVRRFVRRVAACDLDDFEGLHANAYFYVIAAVRDVFVLSIPTSQHKSRDEQESYAAALILAAVVIDADPPLSPLLCEQPRVVELLDAARIRLAVDAGDSDDASSDDSE